MRRLFRFAFLFLLPLTITQLTAGCHKGQATVQPDNNQANTQDQSSDPAAANLPPVPDNTSTPAPTSSGQESPQQADDSSYDPGYGEQPEYTSEQPPPPLLDYDQPQDPGDDLSGRPATGRGLQTAITGFPAHGSKRLTRVRSGPPATGAIGITPMAITPAIGASTLATTAESTTALATPDTATRVVTGAEVTSTTTARSTTSTPQWRITFIATLYPGTRTTPV